MERVALRAFARKDSPIMFRASLVSLIASAGLLASSTARAQSEDAAPPARLEQPSPSLPPRSDFAEPQAEKQAPPLASAKAQPKEQSPPIVLPTRQAPPPAPVDPWFVRPPFVLTAGTESNWKLTIYGFAEVDGMWDSTRSFNDGLNNGVIAHPLTQAGRNPRFQTTIRNSRLGFKAQTPTFYGIRSSEVLEFDLFGNQPKIDAGGGSPGQASGPGATTEAAYFNNAGLRVRHAYVKIEDAVVDVVVGQTYYLLGWQNYFFGASCGFLGLPNQLFNRTVQLRLSHTFESNPVDFEIAAGAFRPAQRDSATPDTQAGARLAINHWKGITTPGSGGTDARSAAIGVSGLARAFRVDQYAPLPAPPTPLIGWALAVNALLPVVPAKDGTDRGNALTVTGEFVTGTGDADQYTGMTAGATMPNAYPLPPGTPTTFAGIAAPQDVPGAAPLVGLPYTANVDPGLVAFDSSGYLRTINWQTFLVGLQYYLPPRGRLFVSANYSQGKSSNIASLYHPISPRQPWVNALGVFQSSRYVDGNVFFDFSAALRLGLSYQWVEQKLADDTIVHNHRFETTFLYFL
jgi:hypothetical protein